MKRKPKPEELGFELSFGESLLRRAPEEPRVIEMMAHLYTEVGRIDEGLELDQRLVRIEPRNGSAHYNLACSLALKGRAEDALATLERAFQEGYTDVDWMLKDPDLKSLRKDPRWLRLVDGQRNRVGD